MENGVDEGGILNEGEILGRNFPLGKRGLLIILCQDLKVRSRMFAHWAFLRNVLPFKDITAIPAVPFDRRILFESLCFLHIF